MQQSGIGLRESLTSAHIFHFVYPTSQTIHSPYMCLAPFDYSHYSCRTHTSHHIHAIQIVIISVERSVRRCSCAHVCECFECVCVCVNISAFLLHIIRQCMVEDKSRLTDCQIVRHDTIQTHAHTDSLSHVAYRLRSIEIKYKPYNTLHNFMNFFYCMLVRVLFYVSPRLLLSIPLPLKILLRSFFFLSFHWRIYALQ